MSCHHLASRAGRRSGCVAFDAPLPARRSYEHGLSPSSPQSCAPWCGTVRLLLDCRLRHRPVARRRGGGRRRDERSAAQHLHRPQRAVVGQAGSGHHLVGQDGACSPTTAPLFEGSAHGLTSGSPVVDTATTPSDGGYWVATADGGVSSVATPGSSGPQVGALSPASALGPTSPGCGPQRAPWTATSAELKGSAKSGRRRRSWQARSLRRTAEGRERPSAGRSTCRSRRSPPARRRTVRTTRG